MHFSLFQRINGDCRGLKIYKTCVGITYIDFSAKSHTILMNQSEYKPALQWFIKYDLGKNLKVIKKGSWALSYDL